MKVRVRIRDAVTQDCERLLPRAQELATSYDVDATAFRTAFEAAIKDPAGVVLVADGETEVVGYALAQLHHTFHANGPVMWVEEVIVIADHRRAGVGGALMREIEARARGLGAAYVALATRRADQFYEALGYLPSAIYYKRTL